MAEAEGMAQGINRGIEQGLEQGAVEIARKMKGMGDSLEKIHIVTGLSLEAVEKL